MADVEAMADMVILAIKSALAPVQARQAALQEQLAGFEARWADLGALRERVAVVEATKAVPVVSQPASWILGAPDEALVDLRARLGLLETKVHTETVTSELAGVRERIAVLETRPQLPGPPGNDGESGQPGKNGEPGLAWKGIYRDDKAYELGHIAKWGGSTYVCIKATTGVKPDAAAPYTTAPDGSMEFRGVNGKDFWELFVSKGDPGKAAK